MPVDYAKLAAQHGGRPVTASPTATPSIDYAALAREHGGSPAPLPAAATAGMMRPSTVHDAPPRTQRDELRDALAEAERDTMNDPMKRVGIGAEKGLEHTIIGLGKVATTLPGLRGNRAALDAADALTKPDGTAENIGYGVEQVGEFIALPTGKGGMVRRATQEAAQTGALSVAQGGDPVTGAAAGAAGPLASRVATAGAERVVPMLREAAEHRVMQALGPTKERFKAMASRITPEILRRGLSGSRESILAKATQVADETGAKIDTALQQYGQRQVGTAPVIDALETAKDAFRTTQQMPVQQALQRGVIKAGEKTPPNVRLANGVVEIDVVFEPRAVQQLDGLQGIIRELGDNATVEQLVAIRRAWDKVVDQAGGFTHRAGGAVGQPLSDQTEAWAKREATGAIRKVLASEMPDLAALNKEFAFWRSLDDVLTQTTQRTQPHGPGLSATIAKRAGQVMGAGGGAAGGVGGMVGGAVIGGEVAVRLQQLLTSPRFRLLDARFKNGLADAIANGNPQAVWGQMMRANAAMMSGGALQPMAAH